MSKSLLTNMERDALKECINIGASHAANALSKLTQETVNIKVPQLELVAVEDITTTIGEPDQVMSTVVMKMKGDAEGTILLMFSVPSALLLSSMLLKTSKSKEVLGEDEYSALRETGNILAGHALNSLSQFLGVNLVQSAPEASSDMVGAMLNEVLVHFLREKHENVLVLSVKFQVDSKEIFGSLFFLFDPTNTQIVLKALKSKLSIDLD